MVNNFSIKCWNFWVVNKKKYCDSKWSGTRLTPIRQLQNFLSTWLKKKSKFFILFSTYKFVFLSPPTGGRPAPVGRFRGRQNRGDDGTIQATDAPLLLPAHAPQSHERQGPCVLYLHQVLPEGALGVRLSLVQGEGMIAASSAPIRGIGCLTVLCPRWAKISTIRDIWILCDVAQKGVRGG